jgi:hypothetical protein
MQGSLETRISNLILVETMLEETRRMMVFEPSEYLDFVHEQDTFGSFWQRIHGDEHFEMFMEDVNNQ